MLNLIGQREGVARIRGWRLSGLLAWFLWRTFYLVKMPGLGRSLRVLIDWTADAPARFEREPLGRLARLQKRGKVSS